MIFRRAFLQKIKHGKLKIAFRRWEKLSIAVGGTLKTPIGVLQFTKIAPVSIERLTTRKARLAGFDTLEELLEELNARGSHGIIYEIHFKRIGPDPREALQRRTRMGKDELRQLVSQLARLKWAHAILDVVKRNPGVASKVLAPKVGISDITNFKSNVRKVKELGLTISLGTGYKLSPRGEKILSQSINL